MDEKHPVRPVEMPLIARAEIAIRLRSDGMIMYLPPESQFELELQDQDEAKFVVNLWRETPEGSLPVGRVEIVFLRDDSQGDELDIWQQ